MKKAFLAIPAAVLAGLVFSGCTTVDSTQKFNAVGIGTANDKAVCQTFVEIPGYYFLGLPVFAGSAMGDGKSSIFRDTPTVENVMSLLTLEAKRQGATRVINVTVNSVDSTVFPIFVSKRTMQASGTGVRAKADPINSTPAGF